MPSRGSARASSASSTSEPVPRSTRCGRRHDTRAAERPRAAPQRSRSGTASRPSTPRKAGIQHHSALARRHPPLRRSDRASAERDDQRDERLAVVRFVGLVSESLFRTINYLDWVGPNVTGNWVDKRGVGPQYFIDPRLITDFPLDETGTKTSGLLEIGARVLVVAFTLENGGTADIGGYQMGIDFEGVVEVG